MKTKRTVTHNSTKKNKRTMSGGKGIISTYTRRFKDCYKKFIRIGDTDDTKKIKKLEAWGGLTGIYKFLKVDEKMYKNAKGEDVSALNKMKENINSNSKTNSSNKDGYNRAIGCLEEGGDNILFNEVCVSYIDFVNGRAAEAADKAKAQAVADGQTKIEEARVSERLLNDETGAEIDAEARRESAAEEQTIAKDSVVAPASGVAAQDGVEGATAPVATNDAQVVAPAPVVDAPVVANDAQVVANDDHASGVAAQVVALAPVVDAQDDVADAQGDAPNSSPNSSSSSSSSSSSEEKGGGGSKRRPKSSRRVKFSKSKKGRTTHRLMRKHRK
jgi:hypothetical protein